MRTQVHELLRLRPPAQLLEKAAKPLEGLALARPGNTKARSGSLRKGLSSASSRTSRRQRSITACKKDCCSGLGRVSVLGSCKLRSHCAAACALSLPYTHAAAGCTRGPPPAPHRNWCATAGLCCALQGPCGWPHPPKSCPLRRNASPFCPGLLRQACVWPQPRSWTVLAARARSHSLAKLRGFCLQGLSFVAAVAVAHLLARRRWAGPAPRCAARAGARVPHPRSKVADTRSGTVLVCRRASHFLEAGTGLGKAPTAPGAVPGSALRPPGFGSCTAGAGHSLQDGVARGRASHSPVRTSSRLRAQTPGPEPRSGRVRGSTHSGRARPL